jgi:hypothetical protein
MVSTESLPELAVTIIDFIISLLSPLLDIDLSNCSPSRAIFGLQITIDLKKIKEYKLQQQIITIKTYKWRCGIQEASECI